MYQFPGPPILRRLRDSLVVLAKALRHVRRVADVQATVALTPQDVHEEHGQQMARPDTRLGVAIQRQTGGDLAEILDKIGYVVRERYRILGQVKALTAEGRLSGVVLIALPFVLFLVMLHIKPDYVSALWTHPLGKQMSIVGLIMQVFGALLIKKIVDIKV